MKLHHYLKLLIILFFIGCGQKKAIPVSPNIIPIPQFQLVKKGQFLLDSTVSLKFDHELKYSAAYLNLYLKSEFNFELKAGKSKKGLQFSINSNILNEEGYSLIIDEFTILIEAKTEKGAFMLCKVYFNCYP